MHPRHREKLPTMTDDLIRQQQYQPEYDVAPHAIFWRPLRWFTMIIREGEDGLDTYEGASFTIGNEISFDLRSYRGHPELTVILYLPVEIDDEKQISKIIDIVIREMLVPLTAVAWRRGQLFHYGQLERPKDDRLREFEARNIVLKIAAQQPHRTASTSFLKRQVHNYIQLSAADRAPSPSRKNELVYQQIVGNVISHHKTHRGPVRQRICRSDHRWTLGHEQGNGLFEKHGIRSAIPLGW